MQDRQTEDPKEKWCFFWTVMENSDNKCSPQPFLSLSGYCGEVSFLE